MGGLWLGVGCGTAVTPAEMIAFAHRLLARHQLDPAALAGIASLDRRRDHPALAALATTLSRPVHVFPAARLAEETPRLTHRSAAVFAATGCHGIAEAAALAAAGAGGWLIVPRAAAGRITLAVARAAVAPGGGECDAGAVETHTERQRS